MKNFNKRIFLLSTILVSILLIFSFLAAFAEDEGSLDKDSFWRFFAKLFYLFVFPIGNLRDVIFHKGLVIIILSFFVNCCCYGFLIERVWYVFKRFFKS